MEKIWDEKYYYIRDEVRTTKDGLGRPIITICLIRIDFEIGRGIAICSELDIPCKKIGRAIAKTRALYALAKEKNSCNIGRWNFKNVQSANNEFMNGFIPLTTKSSYMPELTDYEQKLFNTKNEELFYEEMDEIEFNSRGI